MSFLEDFSEQHSLEHFFENLLEKDLGTFAPMKPIWKYGVGEYIHPVKFQNQAIGRF